MKRKRIVVACVAVTMLCWFLCKFDHRASVLSPKPFSVLAGEFVSPGGTYVVRVYQQNAMLSHSVVWCEYVKRDEMPVVFFNQYGGVETNDVKWQADDVVAINGIQMKLPYSRFDAEGFRVSK